MSPWWLAVGGIAGMLFALLLGRVVVALVRLVRGSVLVSVPLADSQVVGFDSDGAMQLNIEGPMLSTRFARLDYALADAASGAPVPMRPLLVRTRTSGLATARLSIRSLVLPGAGDYRLSVSGLAPGADTAGHAIVFTRDIRRPLVWGVLKIIFASFGLLGALALCLVTVLLGD